MPGPAKTSMAAEYKSSLSRAQKVAASSGFPAVLAWPKTSWLASKTLDPQLRQVLGICSSHNPHGVNKGPQNQVLIFKAPKLLAHGFGVDDVGLKFNHLRVFTQDQFTKAITAI